MQEQIVKFSAFKLELAIHHNHPSHKIPSFVIGAAHITRLDTCKAGCIQFEAAFLPRYWSTFFTKHYKNLLQDLENVCSKS